MIEKKLINKTLELESQECVIYTTQDEKEGSLYKWHADITIPHLARKWQHLLIDGTKVFNSETGSLVEIHGELLRPLTVSLHKRAKGTPMTEEQRAAAIERLSKARIKKEELTSSEKADGDK